RALAYPLARLERYGLFLVIGLLFVLPFLSGRLGVNLNVFYWLIWRPVEWLLPFFWGLAGLG
ncbi:MAG: site-2 protease family protein, partial [Alphaproteobacteria bacterium]